MGNLFYRRNKELLSDVPTNLWDLKAVNIDGEEVHLSTYKDKKALLFVNVASTCGLTYKQFKGMVTIHEKYADKGFEILAFPCNQFLEQEAKCEMDIKTFVTRKFGAKFPLFAKIDVNGSKCHPIFKYLRHNSVLKDPKKGLAREIPFNFAKFLVDSEGKVTHFYAPDIRPEIMGKDIEEMLEL